MKDIREELHSEDQRIGFCREEGEAIDDMGKVFLITEKRDLFLSERGECNYKGQKRFDE